MCIIKSDYLNICIYIIICIYIHIYIYTYACIYFIDQIWIVCFLCPDFSSFRTSLLKIASLPTVMRSHRHGAGVECEEQQTPVLARERLDERRWSFLRLLCDESFQSPRV